MRVNVRCECVFIFVVRRRFELAEVLGTASDVSWSPFASAQFATARTHARTQAKQ